MRRQQNTENESTDNKPEAEHIEPIGPIHVLARTLDDIVHAVDVGFDGTSDDVIDAGQSQRLLDVAREPEGHLPGLDRERVPRGDTE